MSALQQLRCVLELLLVAALFGAVFDVYNTVTGASKWLRFLRPLLDLVYWLGAAACVFFVLLTTDDGKLRLYTFPLLAVGYLLYRLWFHRRVVQSAFLVVRMVQAVLRFVWRIVYAVVLWPVKQVLIAVRFLLLALYRMLCKVEDGVFWVLVFWWKAACFPFRRWARPIEKNWRKLIGEWEGILEQVSKWIIQTLKHT